MQRDGMWITVILGAAGELVEVYRQLGTKREDVISPASYLPGLYMIIS